MLWTMTLVVLFAALTIALVRNLRSRRPAPDAGRPAAFHDALRRLAALSSPAPASPVLHEVASLCATCGSLIPEREDKCVVCAVDRAFDRLLAGNPSHDLSVPAAAGREAGWVVAGRR